MPSLSRHIAALILALIVFSLCARAVRVAQAQTGTPRRLTNTPEESLNLNPSISGDGQSFAFESTGDLTRAGGAAHFRAFRGRLSGESISFAQVANGRAPAPALSQDGSRLAFMSKDDLLATNQDGNSEIFLDDGESLRQITHTTPVDPGRRAVDGCFQPSLTDDGRFIAFSSNRDLTGANADTNFEIFIFDTAHGTFAQITNTEGTVGATEAKISGDGSRVAFIRDRTGFNASPSTTRDLILYDLTNHSSHVVAPDAEKLSLTYGRAISDDGTRLVFAQETSLNASQVFLFDSRLNHTVRQLTSLSSRVNDVSLHPTISGDGSRIAFATRRNVLGGSSDASVELYLYDVPTNHITRLTSAPASATAEVISSLDDAGANVIFNFPRLLTGEVSSENFANHSEIFLARLEARPPFSTDLKISNAASLDRAPTTPPAFAPESIAIARGANLSFATAEAIRQVDATFPRLMEGVSVTVNHRQAQIFYVSPTQVNFLIPPETEIGQADVVVRNPDHFESRTTINIAPTAPGIFTRNANGRGEAIALDAFTLQPGPFDAVEQDGDPRRVIIFATGVRRAAHVGVKIGRREMRVEAVMPVVDLPGLDQIHIALSSDLRGAGSEPLIVQADESESNATTIIITDGGGPPKPARITISPENFSVPVNGTVRFRATVRDILGDEIANAPITFSSSDPHLAAIDEDGLAHGLQTGTVTMTATSGNISATAQLNVLLRTLVINEVLADPPDGIAGDANFDGARSGSADEFIELVNSTSAPLDISRWTIRTRPLNGPNETTRHIFAAGTSIPAQDALVIFGGGDFDSNHPAFGGATVIKTSTAGLSLTNNGLTIMVRDGEGNLVTQFSYDTNGGFGGDSVNQSITRAPDVTGDFARHTEATGDRTRRFSPGRKLDDSFFAPRQGNLRRVQIQPFEQTIFTGETALLTAQAFDQFDRALTSVNFTFTSSAPSVANIENVSLDSATGIATVRLAARNAGQTQITATAHDGATTITSPPATLQVVPLPPRIARVVIAPDDLTINRGGTKQFVATAFDEHNQVIQGATFTWESSRPEAATIDAHGLSLGVGVGTSVISATTANGRGGTVSAQAQLHVIIPLVINEFLADPPGAAASDLNGDANRDGVRHADDDEFIELFNHSNASVDISGVVIADSTNNRFTFPKPTIITAGQSVIIFGGGVPPVHDPSFGGAHVVTANSLSLANSVDTINIKLPLHDTEILLATYTYGAEANANRSLARSPDATIENINGDFTPHPNIVNSDARLFSPGTRADGTPFNSSPITRLEIAPDDVTLTVGHQQTFAARAFSRTGETEVEVLNLSFAWETSDASTASLSPVTGATTTARANAAGSVSLHARAGGQVGTTTLTINPPPPVLTTVTLSPATARTSAGQTTQFVAQAMDQFNQPMRGVNILFTSSDTSLATIDSTTNNSTTHTVTANVMGRRAGSVEIRATATHNGNTVHSPPATLTVTPPPPTISRIEVTPASMTIGAGATQQFQARAFDQHHNEIAGTTFTWSSSNANVATINESGLATGLNAGVTHITASSGHVTSAPSNLNVTAPPSPTPGQIIINEALVSFSAGTPARADFIELFNPTNQTLDLSGLVISFRASGNTATISTITLPGNAGSGTTLIQPQSYFLIVNGSATFGVNADFSATGMDLNNSSGAIKIEIGGVKIDGFRYQQSSSAPPPPVFGSFGEGALFTFTGGTPNDLIRTPNAKDTDQNASDFRRQNAHASVTPRAANPTLP